MNEMLQRGARLAVACCALARGGVVAHGQVQVLVDGQMQLARPMAGIVVPGDVTSNAIGDPWWDEAEAKATAARPAEALADAAARNQAGAGDPRAGMEFQRQMMRRSLEQQVLVTLRRQLSVVREACPTLEPHQRAAVVLAGRGVIGDLAEARSRAAFRRGRGEDPTIEKAIAAALQGSLAASASPAEAEAYERERGLRQERAKQATIAALVADVDRDADLEAGEREALAKVLAESYRERWGQAVAQADLEAMADVALQGFDRCVEQALGKDRTAEWRARREESRKLAAGAGGREIQIMGDAGWVDVPVQVPDAAAGRAIRRRIINDGDGLRLQIEEQAGGEGAEADDEAAADQEP
jgi:hypothetical protein